jgi:hypothetical protein
MKIAILGTVLAGLSLTACTTSPAAQPASTPTTGPVTSVTTTAKTTTKPAPAKEVLGPNGYGGITLGMAKEEALATGKIVLDNPNRQDGCVGYDWADQPTPADQWAVLISP